MQSNNASAETSRCHSSGDAQRRSPSSSPSYEEPAPVPQLGAMSPLSLRHLLSFQQSPTLPWIDNADGTVTTRLHQFQRKHLTSPLVQQFQHQSVGNRMVFLQSLLDEALHISYDVESIISSETHDVARTTMTNGEAKQ